MLRHPRRKLVKLFDRQRPSTTSLVTDRGYSQHPFVNPMPSALGVFEHLLEELQLVLGRPRMLRRSLGYEVLDRRAAQRMELDVAERNPDLRRALVVPRRRLPR